MSSILYSIGRWAFRARKLVLSLWIVLLVALGGGAVLLNQGTDNSFSIPGTESQEALDTLSRTFPQVSGTSAQLVVVAPKGEHRPRTPTSSSPVDRRRRVARASSTASPASPPRTATPSRTRSPTTARPRSSPCS